MTTPIEVGMTRELLGTSRVAQIALFAALELVGFTALASYLFLAGTGLTAQFSVPLYQWWLYLWYYGDDPTVSFWLALSAGPPALLGVLAAAALLYRSRFVRGWSLRRDYPAHRAPTPPIRGSTDNHGHATWESMPAVRRLWPAPDPVYGGVVVGEAYDPRIDTGPFSPYERASWGHGGTAPLLIDPCTLGSTHSLVIAGSGSFKAQPLSAMVLTPTGFRRMGDLRVGDPVQTPAGKIVSILGIYSQGEKDIYRITFRDGRQVESCNDHLWKVWTRWHNTIGPGRFNKKLGIRRPRISMRTMEWRTLPLSTIRDRFENKRFMWKSLAVPLVSPGAIEFPPSALPIPPYTLGVLLGDGRLQQTGGVALSTADEYIKTAVLEELPDYELIHSQNYDYRLQLKKGKRIWVNRRTPLSSALRELGLHGLKSHEKYVPSTYKTASAAQRLALLQGLMDTDGAAQGSGGKNVRTHAAFVTTSEQLARDVQELAWSLGAIATSRVRDGWYKKDGVTIQCRRYWRIQIIHQTASIFFSLPRKINQFTPKSMRHRLNISSIEYVGRKPAQCIRIDDPDGLYVTDNYVVTHNTVSAVSSLLTWTGSSVVLDPAEELGPMLEEARRAMGHRVFVLSPKTAAACGFNVLDWIDIKSPVAETDIDAVVEWICGFTARRDQTAQFFKDQGKAVIRCLLTHMLWDSSLSDDLKTLRTLRKAVAMPEADLRKLLKRTHEISPSMRARELAASLCDLPAETFGGIYANANQDTEWLSTTSYADLVCGSSFKTADITTDRVDVFLSLPLKALQATPAVARCIIGALLNGAYEADGNIRCGRVLFLLDEAARLGSMQAIKVALGAGRKYGITLQLLYQSVGQIEQQWGRDGKAEWYEGASWRSYAAIKDFDTAKEVSETIGNYGVLSWSESQNSGSQARQFITQSRSWGRNISYSDRARSLIRPEELMNDLREDAAIVIAKNARPVLCGRAIYFRRPEFTARVAANRFAKAGGSPHARP